MGSTKSAPRKIAHSLGQAHAAHEALESRIGPKRVLPRIKEDPGMHRSFSKAFFEPRKCTIPIAQTLIHYCYVLRRKVLSCICVFHFVEQLLRFSPPARHSQRMCKICHFHLAAIRQSERLPKLGDRLLLARCFEVDRTKAVVSPGDVRSEIDGVAAFLLCLVVLM